MKFTFRHQHEWEEVDRRWLQTIDNNLISLEINGIVTRVNGKLTLVTYFCPKCVDYKQQILMDRIGKEHRSDDEWAENLEKLMEES